MGTETVIRLPGGVPLVLARVPANGFADALALRAGGSAPDESSLKASLDPHLWSHVAVRDLTAGQWRAIMGTQTFVSREDPDDAPVGALSWQDIAGPKGFLDELAAYLAKTSPGEGGLVPRIATGAEVDRLPVGSGRPGATEPAGFRIAIDGLPVTGAKVPMAGAMMVGCSTSSTTALTCGQSVSGSLTTADCTLGDGTYADLYRVSATAGQQLTLAMSASAFDTYLVLYDSSGSAIASDDDGGGGTNSRLVYTVGAAGTYYVAANALFTGATGSYTLSLQCGSSATCAATTIACGASRSGSLASTDCSFSDGTYYDLYSFQGTQGHSVRIDLTSTAIDPFLLLFDTSGNVVASDDDSGGGANAQIVYTLPSSGTWVIAANSYTPQSGSYTLALQCTAPSTTYQLSVTRSGSGQGTVTSSPSGISCGSTCTASYSSGTSVVLTATPSSGSTFAGWSGACTGTGTCTVSMTTARSVTASFSGSQSGALAVGDGAVCSGGTVTVPVSLSGGSGVMALEFDLTYPSAKLTATAATVGSIAQGASISANVTTGRIRVALASGSALSASNGEVARVTFRGESGMTAGATASIGIENVRVNDVSRTGTGGTATCSSCRKGDVDGNSRVSALDAAIVLQSVVGATTLTATQACAADYNGSGSVTALDAAAILQCVVQGTCP